MQAIRGIETGRLFDLSHVIETGVYLVENLVLDALARERVTSFCIFLLAVKFKGATGCPVRAVAMV